MVSANVGARPMKMRGESSTRVSLARASHLVRFRRATSTSGSSGNRALALDLGCDVAERREVIVERQAIERRLERALLVHE